MEPTSRKIQALVDMFLNKELLLPEMQRKYVWRSTQVRNLIDSIYRDYPSGSILIWETDNIPETKTHPFKETSQQPIGKKLLLLDGQQRITSLASVLEGHPVRVKEGTKIKEKTIEIFFNIDHPDEDNFDEEICGFEVGNLVEAKWEDGEFYPGKITQIDDKRYYVSYDDGDKGWTDEINNLGEKSKKELYFQIRNRKIENKPNWISVTKLFKCGVGAILKELKIGADHLNFEKYNNRLNQLYGRKDYYLYPVQIIRGKSYNEVTDIFIRVNSSGTRLRGSDLALAQITSAWPGSIKLFEEFVDECIKKDFYVDENFLVRCLICIATKQAKFDKMNKIPTEKLKDYWELTKKGVENTINFLKNNAFVDSSALLPSQVLLVPLVYYSSEKDLCSSQEIENGFLRWFYNAAIWGRYSSSMETKLSEDILAFSEKKPWEVLLNTIWKQTGKERKVSVDDIRGKGTSSPLFFMIYVLARRNKAKDLETGTVVSYANFGKNNEIEFDHIFPKSKLDSFLKKRLEESERKRLINEISNLAFMTKKGNIIKTNEDPEDYFPKVIKKHGEEIFEKQQIPHNAAVLGYAEYEKFLNNRAELIVTEVNEFLSNFVK